MRTFARSDIVGLLLAVFLVISGLLTILVPREVFVERLMMGKGASTVEHVSPQRARVYGAVAVASGIALGSLLFWGIHSSRPRDDTGSTRQRRRSPERDSRG